MASAIKQGFDFVFVELLDDRFTCPVCCLVLQEPALTYCGHHFCGDCLEQSLQQSASCPVCRTEIESYYPNNALKREILNLKIKCSLYEKGCEWTGELRNGEMHDTECQYIDVACVNGCEELVMRKDMDDHLQNRCRLQIVICEHCNLSMKQVEMPAHYEVCDDYPVDCTYKCGEVIQRCQMEDHIGRKGTCPKSILDCDFEDSGCQFRGNRHQLRRHTESNVVSHLGLLATALKEELRVTRDKLDETRTELAATKAQFSEEISRRGKSLSLQTTKQFLFTWRIDNWHEKMTVSKEKNDVSEKIRSSSFYVYPGYHMFIGVYPTSFDTTYRGHLGVALFATEGDFDKAVKWPFPFSFEFEVIDQQVGGKNICCHLLSSPREKGLEPGSGYGLPKFTSHQELESRCYIRDNSICVKLCIHLD